MNVYEICPGVFQIEEDYRVYCALAVGTARALLWDTGMGKKNLKAFVEEKAGKPCLVLNSHGHYDHVGGNARFPEAYLAREDWPLLREPPEYALNDLPAGSVYDLGGITAECLDLAGHTKGSRGLYLPERRLLLAGDALNPRLQLLGEEAGDLAMLGKTLNYALALPFERYLTGHDPKPIPRSQAEAHASHLADFDPTRLRRTVQAGTPVWRSEWTHGPRRSVFILGEPAYRSLPVRDSAKQS